MQFLQAISTTLGNTFSVGTLVGLFRATFNQTFLFQAITATFGNTFGVGAFVGVFRTVFSNSAFGVVTVLVFLRTAAGQGLVEVNGVGFDLWGDLFGGWQGEGAGSQDG